MDRLIKEFQNMGEAQTSREKRLYIIINALNQALKVHSTTMQDLERILTLD